MTIRHDDILNALEAPLPLFTQESWDNSGLQVGDRSDICSGVLLSVDLTEEVVDEAFRKGCNLIISHHPLFFRGVKQLTGATLQQRVAMEAIRRGISLYSCHTPVDVAPDGVSVAMASRLGLEQIEVLHAESGANIGLGAIGNIPGGGMEQAAFLNLVKSSFNSPFLRASKGREGDRNIRRVALCGGSGAEFITEAIEAKAEAYITSDVKYHDFLDHGNDILIVDIGHFNAESCTKDIFYQIISKKFANFAVQKSETESNPILYI